MGLHRFLVVIFSLSIAVTGWASEKRLIVPEDLANLAAVSSPAVSPDGKTVAYTVTRDSIEDDESVSQVWVSSWDGSRQRQYTYAETSSSNPGYSPDGKWLALISDRDSETDTGQFCIMPGDGGEARCLTDLQGGVSDYDWSPDSRHVVLVSRVDPDFDPEADTEDKPDPIVIDRLQFKQDYVGYLRNERNHLFLLDIDSGELVQLTDGPYEELVPSFSPDGKHIAFATKRGEDPDSHENWDLYVMEAAPGAEARQLTTSPRADGGEGSRPQWSPDGKTIAFVQGGDPALMWYALFRLAVVPAAGGEVQVISNHLDRNVLSPKWSKDGKQIYFLLEDDQSVQLASIPAGGGKIKRLTPPGQVVAELAVAPGGIVLLTSTPSMPYELQVQEGKRNRQLTNHNKWLDEVALAGVNAVSFNSEDGTEIHALVMTPVAEHDGPRPTLFRPHGGPVAQRQFEFEFIFQALAARGYVVVAPNFRGSSGRGEAFQSALFAKWGDPDLQDMLAAADYMVDSKLADPDRLGIFGWSYGGMLTNYVIASDTRFKAAISGAGMSNMLGGYGHDEYIRAWNSELGAPWENLDTWLKLSYPFLHADRIKTPTLFIVGEKDWNVPLHASEQMYQALRQLGVDTRLVIYPGEHHGLARPEFKLDRLQRYIAWFDQYLGKAE